MTTLHDIDNLLERTIASIGKTIIQYVELKRYYESVMVSDLSGMNVPDFDPYIHMLKLQRESLETIRFHMKCHIEDSTKNEEK